MPSEVKGKWFVSLRRCLEDRDPTALERIIEAMPEGHRRALVEPIATEWYPEETLAQMLYAIDRVLAHGDRDAFTNLMEMFTEVGVNRFFRVMIRISSPRFVLRQVPAMWRQLRSGDGEVEVVDVPNGIEIRYTKFPYFRDPLYEGLTVGSLRALLRVCVGGEVPEITVAKRGREALTIRIAIGE